MTIKKMFKSGLMLCYLLTLTGSTVSAQYASVDTLKGFLCYKFGDTTKPKNAQIKRTESHDKFIVYHIDSPDFCGIKVDGLTLSYYEGKLYQIFLDLAGEKASMSMINIFSKTFGPYNKIEMVSIEYDIKTYLWVGDKVEINYSTDATFTGAKIIIFDKTIKDKMHNLPFKADLNKDEKKLMGRILNTQNK